MRKGVASLGFCFCFDMCILSCCECIVLAFAKVCVSHLFAGK